MASLTHPLRLRGAVLSQRFPLAASRARRPRPPSKPFGGPAFWVLMTVEAGALGGMAFETGWALVALLALAWGFLFAYTGLCRHGWL